MSARRSGKVIVCAVLAVLAGGAFPQAAGAHARLVRTTPAQGAELARAPVSAGLLFDEAVRSTGGASLSGPALQAPLQVAARRERGGRLVVVALPRSLGRGVYTLRWSIVSDDGHREAGAVSFGIGVKPAGVPAGATEDSTPDVKLTLARWLFMLGVLAAAGLAGVRLALRPVLPPGGDARAVRTLAGALALAASGALMELAALPDALGTRFGVVTAVAGALALAGALAAWRAAAWRPGFALAAGLVIAPVLAGHALSPGRPRGAVAPVELAHTAAAAAWLGAILWLWLLPAARRRLAFVAAGAVGVIGATGIARAALELQRWGQLGSTGYGRILLIKTAVFLALIGLGAWSHSRRRPGLGSLRRTAGAEAVMVAAVAALVAGLGSTTPPRALASPTAAAAAARTVFGRQADELAVGIAASRAGDEVAVDSTVLGRDGTGAGGMRVAVAVAAARPRWSPAQGCGDGRYCAHVRVHGPAPRLLVRVRRPSGRASVVSATLPATPQTARAAALVAADEKALRGLRSLAIDERLASDSTHTLHTTWRVVAPDRLSYATGVAGDAIVIGARRWDRGDAASRWMPSAQDPRLQLPALDWERVEDPSLLGPTRVDGRPAWLVSFSDPTVPAWFEVAIDRATRRPLVVRMVAAGHFMVRRYGRFDVPLQIRPPE
jgi:copper transport protein